MKVAEFRETTEDMRRLVNDWHACIDEHERLLWRQRAHRFLAVFMSASCARASSRDNEDRVLAFQQYTRIVMQSSTATKSSHAPTSRAGQYNKSAGRAVRLARAARGAMRRGYF